MTEKEFGWVKQDDYYAIRDLVDSVNLVNGCIFFDEVKNTVDLLNKQTEEIQYWRHKANICLWLMSEQMSKYSFRALLEEIESDGFDLKDKELKEINDLEIKLVEIRRKLFCKDRKLEELGIPIECCDTDD